MNEEEKWEIISNIMAYHDLSDEEWDNLSTEQKQVLAKEAGYELPEE